jgi:hypothetical protein
MNSSMLKLDPRAMTVKRPARPTSREDYFTKARPVDLHGRLGYGGQKPKLVGCEILELTETGAVIETYAEVDKTAELFTLEINGKYQRARLCYAEGQKLRLEFFFEELHYIAG